jgi:hypothetical protein
MNGNERTLMDERGRTDGTRRLDIDGCWTETNGRQMKGDGRRTKGDGHQTKGDGHWTKIDGRRMEL